VFTKKVIIGLVQDAGWWYRFIICLLLSRHNVIPIKKENNQLWVAMSSPFNLSIRDQIEMKTGYKIIPVAATSNAIRQAVHYHFNVTNVTKQAIVSMRLKEEPAKSAQYDEADQESVRVAGSPIAKLVSSIINGARATMTLTTPI